MTEQLTSAEIEHIKEAFVRFAPDSDLHTEISATILQKLEKLGQPTSGVPDDDDKMWKISKLIVDLQSVLDRFGDTCVYIRRGGLSWGAVALNRRSDDEKHGVFDLQAQHDRDMQERLEQIGRLKADRDEWRQKVWDAEAKAATLAAAPPARSEEQPQSEAAPIGAGAP